MGRLASLEELARRGGGSRPVGLEPGRSWDALARRRADWIRVLGPGPGALGLRLSDSFECAAALLAAWSLGRTVYLPSDGAARTLRALGARVGAVLDDASLPAPGTAADAVPLRGFPAVPLAVFTSGSTGEPKAIEKSLACVEAELGSLEAAFGGTLADCPVLATVSHQHYYGLLFRLLWPLAAGRAFNGRRLEFPEEIAAAAAALGPASCALVSSPALLRRVGETRASIEALAAARAVLKTVFSSGGPLPWEAVQRAREALGPVPTEVYGSSETGGVAWRRRGAEDEPYRPLPGVETRVAADGILELRSPHLAAPGWARSDDRAEARGAGFILLGRADRVVKVEEERVSLDALEAALRGRPQVLDARVLPLTGLREALGAVVCVAGGPPPDAAGRRALARELRTGLESVGEAAALPRRWRFVDALPVDAMGKTSRADLAALFGDEDAEPERLGLRRAEGAAELDLWLGAGLRWFRGHFQGFPILPGVIQVHWAVVAAREYLGVRGAFKGLRTLKFTRPMLPGKRVTLAVRRVDGGFEFTYSSDEGKHAGGRVLID